MDAVAEGAALDGDRVPEELLHRLLDRSADVTLLVDASTGQSLRRWYDPTTSRLHLPGSPSGRGITWIHPDDLPTVLDAMATVAHDGGSRSLAARIHPDRVDLVGGSLTITAHDVSDLVPFGLLVHAWHVGIPASLDPGGSAAVMSSLGEAAPIGLRVRSGNGTVSFENRRFAQLVGSGGAPVKARIRSALEREDETVEDLEIDDCSLRLRVVPTWDDARHLVLAVDEELRAEVRAGRRNGYQMEKRFLRRAGHEVWVELTVSTVRDAAGAITHFVSHVEDISDRKTLIGTAESSDELAYWATHDHLTGLPNRRYLDSYLSASIGPRRRAEDRLVVLFLDLDDFKPVNDEHGHQVGDEVLRVIARRLRTAAREDELVARYGGDEFVVVTTRARTAYDVSLLAERILGAVRTPIVGLTDHALHVGASVGIGHATAGEDPGDVVRRADAASYRAKRDGKGRIRHSSDGG